MVENLDGNTLARWKLAAASFAKYHRERARFGGVAFEFHAMVCAFLDGPVPDALDEVVRLRTDLDAALRKQVFVVGVDDSPRVVALEAVNQRLEANLLDYWAAHGAVAHIEEPRAVRDLKAQHREAARQLEAERDGMAKALELARARVTDLDAQNRELSRLHLEWVDAAAVLGQEVARLPGRVGELVRHHADIVRERIKGLTTERDQLATKLAAIEHEDGPPEGTRSFERLAQVTHDWDRAQARVRELEAERLFIIRAHAIEGDHCEDDVVRAIVERLQSSVVGVVWQRDAARAAVERVRGHVNAFRAGTRTPHDVIGCIESALTPTGDGGGG